MTDGGDRSAADAVGQQFTAAFRSMWSDLEPIGRSRSGGYRRFAWTPADATLRSWFVAEAERRGMAVVEDRAGNQWAWRGDPDRDGPGVVVGSHLDSVPDGGAFDGPLGVVSAFLAVDALSAELAVPVGIVHFGDEEGARFGVACAGSRLLSGQLDPAQALACADNDGVTLAEALTRAGRNPQHLGADEEAVRRVGTFVELHIEQGRGLVELDAPVGVADNIWAHGRWRIDLPGEANHAGTTRLEDRRDPMLAYAQSILLARASAVRHGVVATSAKVQVQPNGVNAIPSNVTSWLDARGADERQVRALVADMTQLVDGHGGRIVNESWTDRTAFDPVLRDRLSAALGTAPVLATGAGHDAGIMAAAGISAAMLFVRNPSGISHSPAEHADETDCLAGVAALRMVLADVLG